MSIFTFLGLVVGLALLVLGSDVLVRGAGRLARSAGISSLVVGLTVVAYGTSAPELAVSVSGSLGGEPEVALGNVLGSNVANVLLILGISTFFGTLVVARRLIRIEVPIMVGLSFVAFFFALSGGISRIEGVLLVGAAIAYTVFTIRTALRSPEESAAAEAELGSIDVEAAKRQWPQNVGLIVVGLVALVAGSQFLVNSAVDIATSLGLSEIVIGLTVVAIGTSLPEVATSITAALKGDRDIAVGNVIGSNIFNISVVLGLAATVAPGGMPVPESALTFDFLVVLAVAIACLPVFFTGYAIKPWEGIVFLAYYAAYLTYLVLDATEHEGANLLGDSVIYFVAPITTLTLAVLLIREVGARRKSTHERKLVDA